MIKMKIILGTLLLCFCFSVFSALCFCTDACAKTIPASSAHTSETAMCADTQAGHSKHAPADGTVHSIAHCCHGACAGFSTNHLTCFIPPKTTEFFAYVSDKTPASAVLLGFDKPPKPFLFA